MSDAQDYLVTIDRDGSKAQHILLATAARLEAKETSLIGVIESLREYINDEEPAVRAKAVTYLAHLIEALPTKFLSRQQIQVLCQFLCDRIDDDGATMGLERLVCLPRFHVELAVTTFRATVESFRDLQIRTQPQRFQVLKLVSCLLREWRHAVKDLGSFSVIGITDLVGGEKDPRNLMIVFSILQVVIFEFDIRQNTEILFDVVFCYFPITFRPPPNDPYGITAQQLKHRLRDCIAASRLLAPLAFPQLIEKLDSSSLNVKRDVLDAFIACASSYGSRTISSYSVSLWDALKYEIFNGQDDEITQAVLSALTAVTRGLDGRSGSNSITEDDPHEEYMQVVIKECLEKLQEPQLKQAKAAFLIIKACAEASPQSLSLTIKTVTPILFTLYQDSSTMDQRRTVLDYVYGLLSVAKVQADSEPKTQPTSALFHLKNQIFEMSSQALMGTPPSEFSLRISATRCLSLLCEIPGLLGSSEQGMVVQYMDDVLLGTDDHPEPALEAAMIETLTRISSRYPSLVMDITIPVCMSRLPEFQPADDSYTRTLEVLAAISSQTEISNALARRLYNRLDSVIQHDGSKRYCIALVSTIAYILGARSLTSDPELERHWHRTLALLERCAEGANGHVAPTLLNEVSVLEPLGKLVGILLRAMDRERQGAIMCDVYRLFAAEPPTARLWQPDWPASQRSTIVIVTYVIAAVEPKTALPFPEEHYASAISSVIDMAMHEDLPPLRNNILRHLALQVNKFTPTDQITWVSDVLLEPQRGLLDISKVSRQTLRVGTWLSKALVARLCFVDAILSRYMDLFAHPELGHEAARGFETILAEDEIFTRDNGATIRALTNQRVFTNCIQAISNRYWSATTTNKENYLLALSGLLAHVDKHVMILESSKLLPLLLSSMDIEQQEVRVGALKTLEVLSLEIPDALQGHVNSLVGRCVKVAGEVLINTQTVRYQALRCLRAIAENITAAKLLPYRRIVSQGILVVLDDPRRDVRKEAVDCRTTWASLDDTEDDE